MQRFPVGILVHITKMSGVEADNFCYGFVVGSSSSYDQIDDGELKLQEYQLTVRAFLMGKWKTLVFDAFDSVLEVIPPPLSPPISLGESIWKSSEEIKANKSISKLVENYYIKRQESVSFIIPDGGFRDGMESQLSKTVEYFVKNNFLDALGLFGDLILYNVENPEISGEILRRLGNIDDEQSYPFRRWILEKALSSPHLKIRDAAVVGLGFIMDLHSVEYLYAAMKKEQIPELKEDMVELLARL